MDNKYKKFITVGLLSVAISLGATVSPNAEAINMPPVRVSTVATNVAISSSHNAANIAIANSKTKSESTKNEMFIILGGTFLALLGSVGWIMVDSSKKDIKKQISNIRNRFNTFDKSDNKRTL